MAGYYPPVGFHFSVSFDTSVTSSENDSLFQSVSGLNVELETESIKEGGENRFMHMLPVRSKYPNLVLKRGMLTDSEVIQWCLDAFENLEIRPADLQVSMLNENHEPLVTWNIKHAWPVKWNISDMSAEESKVMIETIELYYQFFTVETS
jgi:phage tail-like protein